MTMDYIDNTLPIELSRTVKSLTQEVLALRSGIKGIIHGIECQLDSEGWVEEAVIVDSLEELLKRAK